MANDRAKKNNEITLDVKEKCGIISDRGNGYTLELRYVSWNGAEPKYDIRVWYKDKETGEERNFKGVTMTGEELVNLAALVNKLAEDENENAVEEVA